MLKKTAYIAVWAWILLFSIGSIDFAEAQVIKSCDNTTQVKWMYGDPEEGQRVVVQGAIVFPETADELKMIIVSETPTLVIDRRIQHVLTITDVPDSVVGELEKLSYAHNPDAYPGSYQYAQATQKFITVTGEIHYVGNDTVPVIVYLCHTVEDYGL